MNITNINIVSVTSLLLQPFLNNNPLFIVKDSIFTTNAANYISRRILIRTDIKLNCTAREEKIFFKSQTFHEYSLG
jgi:hypothetical protein